VRESGFLEVTGCRLSFLITYPVTPKTLYKPCLVYILLVFRRNPLNGWNLEVVELRPNNLLRSVIEVCRFYLTGPLGLEYWVMSDEMAYLAFFNLLAFSAFDRDSLRQLSYLRVGRGGP